MIRPGTLDLYLVTDRLTCAAKGLDWVVAEAVSGGAGMIQLRDDVTGTAELTGLAGRLIGILRPLGVPLIVNNRIEVAEAAGADGVHLGQADASPSVARARLGPHALVGWSVTSPEQVAGGVPAGVDYLGVGPVFATATKADAAPPMGLAGLALVRARTTQPIVAIGGIDRANAPSVIAAGADGIAVVSALCASTDPAAAARDLARIVAGAKERRTT